MNEKFSNNTQFTISVKHAFSGLFFRKQKGTRVFQWQEDLNAVVISALSSRREQNKKLYNSNTNGKSK